MAEPPWDWPLWCWWGPHPIPDLTAIPLEKWKAALRDTHRSVRQKCVTHLPPSEWAEGTKLELELASEGHATQTAVERRLAWPDPLPKGDPGRPRRSQPRSRQVNFRLDDGLFASLDRAAAALGMRPSALARLLTTRGLAGLERERRAAR